MLQQLSHQLSQLLFSGRHMSSSEHAKHMADEDVRIWANSRLKKKVKSSIQRIRGMFFLFVQNNPGII